jgi:hypothetical protein
MSLPETYFRQFSAGCLLPPCLPAGNPYKDSGSRQGDGFDAGNDFRQAKAQTTNPPTEGQFMNQDQPNRQQPVRSSDFLDKDALNQWHEAKRYEVRAQKIHDLRLYLQGYINAGGNLNDVGPAPAEIFDALLFAEIVLNNMRRECARKQSGAVQGSSKDQ